MCLATALDKAFENIDCMSAVLRCGQRSAFVNQRNALSTRVEYYGEKYKEGAMRRAVLAFATSVVLAVTAVSQSRAEDLVRIGLAVPSNAIYAPFYAAEKLGLFKEASLKVELTIYRGGAASQEALSAGAADMITYFGGGAGLAILKGAKEKVVAALDPSPHGWYLLVQANAPFKSVKDLEGKKVGVTVKGGTSDMFALWAADRAGIKIQTIPVGGGGMVPALKSEQVDAIAMFPGSACERCRPGKHDRCSTSAGKWNRRCRT